MKKIEFSLLVAITLCFVTNSFAQSRNYKIKNGFALSAGVTQFDIITNNFQTVKGEGWIGGMSATVSLPHRWYAVSYGMQLSENKMAIAASKLPGNGITEMLDYKVFAAQVAFLFHIKLVKDFITLDVGPVLQYNSRLELIDEVKEDYFIANYESLSATDISDISNVNFNGAVGLSAGYSHFRIKAQYLYGFTNMLNKLNNQAFNKETATKFKGMQSMVAITGMITF